MDDMYAQNSATPSIREAFFPSLVIDGAIKPITISGTQKLISSDKINRYSYNDIHHCAAGILCGLEPGKLTRNDPEHHSHKQF